MGHQLLSLSDSSASEYSIDTQVLFVENGPENPQVLSQLIKIARRPHLGCHVSFPFPPEVLDGALIRLLY